MSGLIIYYAHCVQLYGSEQEKRDISTLTNMGFNVLNPNHPDHAAQFEKYKMEYFTDQLIPTCDALAFRSLPSGELTAGVAVEVQAALDNDLSVIELPSLALRKFLDVDRTRSYLHECGER